jgi:hypothetical protein
MSTLPIKVNHSQPPARNATQLPDSVRYIGVNIRSSSFAFVLVEGGTVLDSGIRKCELPQYHDCLRRRFDRILQTYTPSATIISFSLTRGLNPRQRAVGRGIKAAIADRGVEVIIARPAVICRYFDRFNAETKYQIAQVVAEIFPELAWKLPPKRRAWQHETARMSIFDAAAAVIAHLMTE